MGKINAYRELTRGHDWRNVQKLAKLLIILQ